MSVSTPVEDDPKQFYCVASVAAFENSQALKVEVEGKQVAIFHTTDGYIATTNICPHAGGPLNEGDVDGNIVTCPWHGLSYDLGTGICIDDPGFQIERYTVKVEGGNIYVAV